MSVPSELQVEPSEIPEQVDVARFLVSIGVRARTWSTDWWKRERERERERERTEGAAELEEQGRSEQGRQGIRRERRTTGKKVFECE